MPGWLCPAVHMPDSGLLRNAEQPLMQGGPRYSVRNLPRIQRATRSRILTLNFSGEYHSKAHAYAEVSLFGKGKAYRAGTVGTLAEKTAYGYVHALFTKSMRQHRNEPAKLDRLASGCAGVKTNDRPAPRRHHRCAPWRRGL